METGETVVLEQKVLSFGELLVGIEFNPSNDDRVHEIKQKMAEVANMLKEAYTDDMRSPVKSLIFDHAIGELLSAQMAAVKLVTFKG